MTINYAAIDNAFGELDVEITTKPGKGWFGGKYLEVSAKITGPKATIETTDGRKLNVLYPGPSTVKKSVKLGITDEGYDTVENTKKLGKLVLKTASKAYATRFLEIAIPEDAISDDYNGRRTEKLEEDDRSALRDHIKESLDNFADTLAKKLTETTGVTDIKPPSGAARWFSNTYGLLGVYYTETSSGNKWFLDLEGNGNKAPAAAERQLNKTMRETREKYFLKEKTTTYAHTPQLSEGKA